MDVEHLLQAELAGLLGNTALASELAAKPRVRLTPHGATNPEDATYVDEAALLAASSGAGAHGLKGRLTVGVDDIFAMAIAAKTQGNSALGDALDGVGNRARRAGTAFVSVGPADAAPTAAQKAAASARAAERAVANAKEHAEKTLLAAEFAAWSGVPRS